MFVGIALDDCAGNFPRELSPDHRREFVADNFLAIAPAIFLDPVSRKCPLDSIRQFTSEYPRQFIGPFSISRFCSNPFLAT
jgi:hypothetical protein